MAPCVAVQKGRNVLPDKCFFVEYVKDYTDVSLICWVNLRPFLVMWSVLVYTARKQARRAFLRVARLGRHEVKAIYTALAFTGLIHSSWTRQTNSQVHVMQSPG